MDSCYNIDNFKHKLISAVNNSELTVGCALYVVKDVYNELLFTFRDSLDKEIKGLNIEHEITDLHIIDDQDEEEMENGEQNND